MAKHMGHRFLNNIDSQIPNTSPHSLPFSGWNFLILSLPLSPPFGGLDNDVKNHLFSEKNITEIVCILISYPLDTGRTVTMELVFGTDEKN